MPLRVVYVWNTAGALTQVADWLSDNGHESRILMRTESDPYGTTARSPNAVMTGTSKEFFKSVKW